MSAEPMTPRLLVFVDAMCSWCYGFAPEIEAIRDRFRDRLEYLTFSGGLRPFASEPMDKALREKLANEVYPRIALLSGQPFAPAWMKDETFIYDTEPASRGIVTMRAIAPEADYSFYLSIQRAFYAEGRDIRQTEVLADYAEALGTDRAAFLEAFASEDIKEATLNDFRVAQRFEIDGFPTLLIHRQLASGEARLAIVAKGYEKAEDIIPRIEAALDDDAYFGG